MAKADPLRPILIAAVCVLACMLAEARGLPAGCDLPSFVVPISAPIADAGFRILIVEESSQRRDLPASQAAIFSSAELSDYAKAKCVSVDGVPEFRIYDPDVVLTNESDVWRKALAIERKSLPWLIVSDGRRGFSGPLPLTLDETMAIVKRYGG